MIPLTDNSSVESQKGVDSMHYNTINAPMGHRPLNVTALWGKSIVKTDSENDILITFERGLKSIVNYPSALQLFRKEIDFAGYIFIRLSLHA